MQRISFLELVDKCGPQEQEFLASLGENGIYFFRDGNSYYALHDFSPGIVFVDFLIGSGLKPLRVLQKWLLKHGYRKAAFYCKENSITQKLAKYFKAEIYETNFHYRDGKKAISCLIDLKQGRFRGESTDTTGA